MPKTNRSTVSSATRFPAYFVVKSFGLRSTFCRFTLTIRPVPVIFCGTRRNPPQSAMRRVMVRGLGQGNFFSRQNTESKGYSFSPPRFGYFSRSLRNSSMIRMSHKRLRFFLGARLPSFRLSSFPCSYGAVLLPKGQYSDPLLCLLGNHIQEA